jgi:hypothetical protein
MPFLYDRVLKARKKDSSSVVSFKLTTAEKKTKKTTTKRIHQLNELHLLLKKIRNSCATFKVLANQKQDFLKKIKFSLS